MSETETIPPHQIMVSILMPVRNEGLNLRIMLKMLKAVVEVPYEILIVHDDAEDDSVAIVDTLRTDLPELRRIHNTLGAGVINAIRAGVECAKGEYVLLFAADEVGPVLAIEDMLALMEDGCDFVSCTRYAHSGRRLGGSLVGQILSRLANRLFRIIAGTRLTDCTTGIKMFRRDIFDRLDLQSKPIGWAVAFEMAMKAEHIGLRLGEVPIISIDRLYGGQSTFRPGQWCIEYSKWFLWGAFKLRRKSRDNRVLVRMPQTCAVIR